MGSIGFILCLLLAFISSTFCFLLHNGQNQYHPSTSALSAGGQVPMVPYYPTKGKKDYQWMDIYNALGRERTLFVSRYLDDEACNQLVASLIWLQGKENSLITMYFNVPGAMIKPTLAVFDVMQKLKCPVKTINMGLTVGMSSLLVAAGTKGMRYVTPNARFLVGKAGLDDGVQGQSSDIALQVAEVMKDNNKGILELGRLCGIPNIKLQQDMKRDFYLTAPEAVMYGIVDEVLMPPEMIKVMKHRGDDDSVINYGHFVAERPVAPSANEPAPVVETIHDDFDEYAAREMMKKKRPANSRFANSRVKPPANLNKGDDDKPKGPSKDLGKNAGF